MKTIIMSCHGAEDFKTIASWYFIPDSGLINPGKPFFIPEISESVEVSLSPAVKITRLGKTIAPRFASRYYTEIAPCLHFRMKDLYERLRTEGLPADRAVAYDRCFIVGPFTELKEENNKINYSLNINNLKVTDFTFDCDITDKALVTVSLNNTMKTGDLLVASLTDYFPVSIGDNIEVLNNEQRLLLTKVK